MITPLRNVVEKYKARDEKSKFGINPGMEMTYNSNMIFYQFENDIHVSKNRISGELGFVELIDALDLILKEYFRGDLISTLTPSACWNEPIKEELNEAIRGVLKKYSIL